MPKATDGDHHTLFLSLGAATVLERERAVNEIEVMASGLEGAAELKQFLDRQGQWVLSEKWEERLGYLLAQTIAMRHVKEDGLAQKCLQVALGLLIDPEVRVRLAVGECLGGATAHMGPGVWEVAQQPILEVIEFCWDRDTLVNAEGGAEGAADPAEGEPGSSTTTGGEGGHAQPAPPGDFVSDLLQSSYHRHKPGTGEMRHGTEGWQALETSVVAVRSIVEGTGAAFAPFVTPELRRLLYKATRHPNRFIRETSYHTLAAVCTICRGPPLESFGTEVAECLQDGLSENWSQVRYAACVCARAFLVASQGSETRYFPTILPHLCFNRYDVAEGVRYYSLDTWKLVLKTTGPTQVAAHINQVVSYYVRCAKTNNHTVREAACVCMAELFMKIDKAAVLPHLTRILRTLFRALKDDSWTVRDAASTAYAKAVLAFPEECRPFLEEVWPIWLALLDENVFSVREHAAEAVADVVRAYKQEALDKVMPVLRENLSQVRQQPADAGPSASLGSGGPGGEPTEADRQERDSQLGFARALSCPGPLDSLDTSFLKDSDTLEDEPSGGPPDDGQSTSPSDGAATGPASGSSGTEDALFKQESLLRAKPKDTGGVDYSCGCMDYGFKRDRQPWEASDGAVYLLAALSKVAPKEVAGFLPSLAELALLDHFTQARAFQTTIWSQLPIIMTGLGKRDFKLYIEDFLTPVFRSLVCENQLCRAAAGRCLAAIRDEIGPRIFAGRLSEQQRAAMESSPDVPALAGVYASIPIDPPPEAIATKAPWVK